MIKELQKQIEERKQELIKPVKEEFEQVFQGFDVEVGLNTDNLFSSLLAIKNEGGNFVQLAFLAAEEKTFSSTSFKQNIENGIVTSVQPTPFTIDTSVINYVFYKLNELIDQVAPSQEPEEE